MATSKKVTSKKQASPRKAAAQGKCPEPSGKYAFSANGHLLIDNPHEGPVAWAGYIEFTNGIITGSDTVNYADDSPVERNFTGTYSVEQNCAVTVNFSFTLDDPHATAASASLYFAAAMKEFRMVQRDQLRVCSGSGIKV
ncbi:MAG: hypothetical protein QOC99_3158 [Acidobacteriota bacterium]|jgi:hypothetical protein|nr:hypothetical protein [Acidobacteriota bacterium]MDT7780646.1 hypothetical protein [Acidobacteriota bacterium]